MANGMTSAFGQTNPPDQPPQYGATETHSRNILGPTFFDLYDLRVEGGTEQPQPPGFIAPSNSPHIIASNETFKASVKIKFNDTPLTRLLLCLGTVIKVHFAFEGVGGKAVEKDLEASIETEKGHFEYTITYEGTPDSAGLTQGFYAIAAVAEVGPAKHPCAQYIFGYGYVAKALLQVYQSFS
jgi:hypothetical protein